MVNASRFSIGEGYSIAHGSPTEQYANTQEEASTGRFKAIKGSQTHSHIYIEKVVASVRHSISLQGARNGHTSKILSGKSSGAR